MAQQQLTLEPWREEAHQQLMQALALQGNRSAALTQYEMCCRLLKDEIGIEPAAKTKTLAARIRDQQLDQHVRRHADGSHEQQRLITPFVGRHREYETLVKTYQQVTQNRFQLVSLVGNAGMGKTRLAQQFLAWAAVQGQMCFTAVLTKPARDSPTYP